MRMHLRWKNTTHRSSGPAMLAGPFAWPCRLAGQTVKYRGDGFARHTRNRHSHLHLSRHRHVGRRADDRLRLLRSASRPTRATTATAARCSSSTPRGNILIDTTPELRLQLLRAEREAGPRGRLTRTTTPITCSASTTCGSSPPAERADADLLHRRGGGSHPPGVRLRLPPERRGPARRDAARSSNSAASTSGPFDVLGERFTPIPLHPRPVQRASASASATWLTAPT